MNSHKYVTNNGTYEILGRNYGKGKSNFLIHHNVVSKMATLPGSKHWSLCTADETRTKSALMRFLKLSVEVAWHHIRNENIRHQPERGSINHGNGNMRNRCQQSDHLPRAGKEYRSRGRRVLGKPRKCWEKQKWTSLRMGEYSSFEEEGATAP